MPNWKSDLLVSVNRFNKFVKPELKKLLGGEFYTVESVSDVVSESLDAIAGVDVWHISPAGIRGIASRIQTSNTDWSTFTIRNKRDTGSITEYEKRKNAINNGYLYPYYMLQAYVSSEDKLLSFAIANTIDVIKMIDSNLTYVNHTGTNQVGQASFFVVKWEDMKDYGYDIHIGR